jgi:hypothetical protein
MHVSFLCGLVCKLSIMARTTGVKSNQQHCSLSRVDTLTLAGIRWFMAAFKPPVVQPGTGNNIVVNPCQVRFSLVRRH